MFFVCITVFFYVSFLESGINNVNMLKQLLRKENDLNQLISNFCQKLSFVNNT